MSVFIGPAKAITLLNRYIPLRANAPVSLGKVVNGDLLPWFVRLEFTDTLLEGKVNNAELTMSVDPDGTFIRDRNSPILVNADAKNSYLIEITLTQGVNAGKTIRGQLGEATIQDDAEGGEIFILPINAIEYVSKEIPCSLQNGLVPPYVRLNNLINFANLRSSDPTAVQFFPVTNTLPSNPGSNQDWLPFQPTAIYDLFQEIVEKQSDPAVVGGSYKDYFIGFLPDPTGTLDVQVIADLMGSQDSGVVVNPLLFGPAGGGSQQDKTIITDNTRYKNNVILIGNSEGGSLPMEHTRFASMFLHVQERPEFNLGGTYGPGDSVTETNNAVSDPNKRVKYFKVKDSVTSSFVALSPPDFDFIHWTEDFSTDPTNPVYFSYTPWTDNLDVFNMNMDGLGEISFHLINAVGWFADWNIAVANYDDSTVVGGQTGARQDPTNEFQAFSIKWVTRTVGDPSTIPARELYHGQRYLVSSAPSGDFALHANCIAQYDVDFTSGNAVWEFSNPPVVGDTVNNKDTAHVLKWNGTSFDIAWGVDYDGFSVNYYNQLKDSPFHIVNELTLVTGATDIPNSAIQARFAWAVNDVIPPDDTQIYASSRGAWLTFWFPQPRLDTLTGGINLGSVYGGDGTNAPSPQSAALDTRNLSHNRQGLQGYNRGRDSEDHGRISAIRFKLRLGFFTSPGDDDTSIVNFISDIPMVFWCMDIFDRVYFFEFKLRRNNSWQLIQIPVGELAAKQMYFSRGDELPKRLGYTLPWDFTLAEKEYTGVNFDWEFVRVMGVFYKGSYTPDSGFYSAAQQTYVDQLFQYIIQQAADGYNILPDDVKSFFSAPTSINIVINHTTLAMDELYFVKEQIVNSSDVALPNPITSIEHEENIDDYFTLKAVAQAKETRLEFFTQHWHMRAIGDVRLMAGKKFIASGGRVPGGSQSLVCTEVKHIIDNDGYFMELYGIRKFILSNIGLSPTSGHAGSFVLITGSGFTPLDTINIYFDGSIFMGSIPAGSDGTFGASFQIPAFTGLGNHTITANDNHGTTASANYLVN